eukprot:88163_1
MTTQITYTNVDTNNILNIENHGNFNEAKTNYDDNSTQCYCGNKHTTFGSVLALFTVVLIWMVLIVWLLTLIVSSIHDLSWIIYLEIPLYVIYLIECFCCSGTPSYLKNTKAPHEAREYIDKLITAKPSITWTIEHYHTNVKKKELINTLLLPESIE